MNQPAVRRLAHLTHLPYLLRSFIHSFTHQKLLFWYWRKYNFVFVFSIFIISQYMSIPELSIPRSIYLFWSKLENYLKALALIQLAYSIWMMRSRKLAIKTTRICIEDETFVYIMQLKREFQHFFHLQFFFFSSSMLQPSPLPLPFHSMASITAQSLQIWLNEFSFHSVVFLLISSTYVQTVHMTVNVRWCSNKT